MDDETSGKRQVSRARVAILSSFDNIGGAGRATYRLFNALRESDRVDVDMYVAKPSESENIKVWPDQAIHSKLLDDFENFYIEKNRTDVSDTMFSLTVKGGTEPQIDWDQYDVVNLHWVEKFFSYRHFRHLAAANVPIVWTMHDMRPFTGGCHYSFGCSKYQTSCTPCTQLRFDPLLIARQQLRKRIRLFDSSRIVGVSPSEWLATLARSSRFFSQRDVQVIHNSLELDRFRPLEQTAVRRQLELPEDAFIMLFGAHDGREKRKGFAQLLAVLEECRRDTLFRSLCDTGKVLILTLGIPDQRLAQLGIPARNLGFIKEDDQLAAAYNAADVFVLPSLYDNLPNTMLESLACGTPIVSFGVGGIPEILDQGCGFVVEPYRVNDMARTLLQLIGDQERLREKARQCRCLAVQLFAPLQQADLYADLFEQIK